MSKSKVISIISAMTENRAIGKNNDLVVKSKEDLNFFKEVTQGSSLIMGRKTWESLPGVLKGREHIVLTKSDIDLPGGVKRASSFDEALELTENDNVFVIGGESFYKEALIHPQTKNLYLTLFSVRIDDADAFFPPFSPDWEFKETVMFITDPCKGRISRYEKND